MNYQKIDASLSEALSGKPITDKRDLIVFIRTAMPPDAAQIEELKRLNVTGVPAQRNLFSAEISSRAVSELSDKPWVVFITLSGESEPL